jgi:hypothetical protein
MGNFNSFYFLNHIFIFYLFYKLIPMTIFLLNKLALPKLFGFILSSEKSPQLKAYIKISIHSISYNRSIYDFSLFLKQVKNFIAISLNFLSGMEKILIKPFI